MPHPFSIIIILFLRITNNARCKVNYFLSICNLFTLFSFKCDRKDAISEEKERKTRKIKKNER